MGAVPVRIAVVGSANVDLTFRTPRLPQPGETLTGHGFHLGFGGKGANQAVMAARLGASVSLVARIGADAFGQEMLRHLGAEGMDLTHVKTDRERPTGTAAIVVDDAARNCILVVPGANHGLSPQDVQAAAPVIQSAAFVLCQLEVPLPAIQEAFRIARATGVRTILNPAPAAPLPDDLLALTDLCAPNETELQQLTGQHAGSLGEVESAARMLLRRGAKAVAVTLGERGALLVENEKATHVPAVTVSAVDPTGAGDAFIGSLAVFWAEGHSLPEAARRACAVASLTVTRPGAQSAFPSRTEVVEFLRKSGVKE
jgi:ribokinase